MNKEQVNQVAAAFGDVAKKVADSAIHAAIFAFVSKKVSNFMTKQEEKNKDKVRIEDPSVKLEEDKIV